MIARRMDNHTESLVVLTSGETSWPIAPPIGLAIEIRMIFYLIKIEFPE
jgi:hypothetical protein